LIEEMGRAQTPARFFRDWPRRICYINGFTGRISQMIIVGEPFGLRPQLFRAARNRLRAAARRITGRAGSVFDHAGHIEFLVEFRGPCV